MGGYHESCVTHELASTTLAYCTGCTVIVHKDLLHQIEPSHLEFGVKTHTSHTNYMPTNNFQEDYDSDDEFKRNIHGIIQKTRSLPAQLLGHSTLPGPTFGGSTHLEGNLKVEINHAKFSGVTRHG